MKTEQLIHSLEERSKRAGLWSELMAMPTKDKVMYGLGTAGTLSSIARAMAYFIDKKNESGSVNLQISKDQLEAMMSGEPKMASIGSTLLHYLPRATLVGTLRNIGRTLKAKSSDNAWSDALREKPIRALIPGLESEFKQLYVDSPSAADRLLDVF